jgi:hypothetical protein
MIYEYIVSQFYLSIDRTVASNKLINFGRQCHSLTQWKMLHCKTVVIVIYGISGLFKILPTRGICNLRGLARVGYYLEWVVLNNPRMPYNVLSNIPKFLDNDIIDEILLPMGYGR